MVTANPRREQQNVSLLPRHKRALDWLAQQSGSEQKSPVVRELIEREMRSRLGLNWDEELAKLESDAA